MKRVFLLMLIKIILEIERIILNFFGKEDFSFLNKLFIFSIYVLFVNVVWISMVRVIMYNFLFKLGYFVGCFSLYKLGLF